MTRAEARRRAVEAAALALIRHDNGPQCGWDDVSTQEAWAAIEAAELAFAAAESAMSDAGWRMVRDVPPSALPAHDAAPPPDDLKSVYRELVAYSTGWNACRAAMLEDEP